MKGIIMIGYKNEFFEILELVGRDKKRQKTWLCRCKCGNATVLGTSEIKHKRIKSCGCSRKGKTLGNKFGLRHGLCVNGKDPFYEMRNRILTRCYNAKPSDYPYYQGRGIKVCDEWINNPLALKEWALARGWQKGLVLDRIDPNGDYSPENCQFLTVSENLKKMHQQKSIKRIKVDVKERCFRCKCSAPKDAQCKKENR
jgi:hypothetical protein